MIGAAWEAGASLQGGESQGLASFRGRTLTPTPLPFQAWSYLHGIYGGGPEAPTPNAEDHMQ